MGQIADTKPRKLTESMQCSSAPKIRFLLLRFLLNLVKQISEIRDNWVSIVAKLISLSAYKISDKIHKTVIKELSYEHLVFVEYTALQNLYGRDTTQAVL